MGLDYSYLLYFKREALWDVLQGITSISRPCPLPTLVAYPDHFRLIHLEAWGRNERIIYHDDPQFRFAASIYFPPDDDIITYLKHFSREKFNLLAAESPLGLPVGSIYITVYNDPAVFDNRVLDPDQVLFEFGTPGSTMSILFSESVSIRKRFEDLLVQYEGVCGVLNLEDYAHVIWLNGHLLDVRIPNPFMPPSEIINFMKEHEISEGEE